MNESEKDFAIRLANTVLDDAGRDPDGDISVLARQFLRALEPNWLPIATAVKDGTPIRLRNSVMQRAGWSIIGKWGRFKSDTMPQLPESEDWIVVLDDHEQFMPLRPGKLVVPDEWLPLTDAERLAVLEYERAA